MDDNINILLRITYMLTKIIFINQLKWFVFKMYCFCFKISIV